MKTKKYIQSLCQNYCEDKHVDLLLIGERKEKHYVLIVEFIYDYTIDRRRKHFFFLLLLASFRTTDVLKYNIDDCFKINGKQKIRMPMKGEYVKFKNYERKI